MKESYILKAFQEEGSIMTNLELKQMVDNETKHFEKVKAALDRLHKDYHVLRKHAYKPEAILKKQIFHSSFFKAL